MVDRGYKGHAKGSKTEKLHREYDKNGREAAMKLGLKLGYSSGGAGGWISHWAKQDRVAKVKKRGKAKAA